MTTASAQILDTIVYKVKGGDTLGAIIKHYYGNLPPDKHRTLINRIQTNNPDIKNPDRIYPDQLIKLEVPAQYCPAPSGFPYHFAAPDPDQEWFSSLQRNWASSSPNERSMFPVLSQILLGSGSANMAMIDRTFKANSPLLIELVENYESYKRGDITKGQYNYRRTKLISQFSSRLGPTNLLLNGRADPREVLRISRAKGVSPTQAITAQIDKVNRLSKVASRGGIALSVVGLGIACHEIAHAGTQQEKNEIFVEAMGGLTGGALFGVGVTLGLFVMATPVGWVAALAIGVGGAAVGYFSGLGAKKLYDASGKEIDFTGKSGVSSLCSTSGSANYLHENKPLISNSMQSVL